MMQLYGYSTLRNTLFSVDCLFFLISCCIFEEKPKLHRTMAVDYMCPDCKGHLRVDEHIILTVKQDGEKGMLLLINPELGNYQTIHHQSHSINEGHKFDFFCPICHSKLHSDLNDNLAMVLMRDTDEKIFELHFSRISGQKSTYQIMGKEVKTFGIDAPHYLDFMNLIDMS